MLRTWLDEPRRVAARRWCFQVHMWAGVIAAAYVMVSCITGTLLVFREELSSLTAPRYGDHAAGIGPDRAMITLADAAPGFRVGSLVLPRASGDGYGAYVIGRGRYAYAEVDPATGALTRIVTRENSWWRFLEDLHNNLLTGRTGRVVNGVGGVAVALLALTGAVIWWPGRRRVSRAVRVDWRARWPRRLWDLHSVTGVVLLPLVFVIAVTGAYFTWPQIFRRGVAAVLPVAPREAPLRLDDVAGREPARISTLIAAARAAVPDARVASVQIPGAAGQPFRAFMLRDGQTRQPFADVVVLHPITADVVRVERYADRPAGERLLRWMGPLHGGHFGGAWVGLLWVVAGVGMTLLAATGLAVWWNRTVRPRLRAREVAGSAEPAPVPAGSYLDRRSATR
jgi:uncharacterized iron-regulated membrane protein